MALVQEVLRGKILDALKKQMDDKTSAPTFPVPSDSAAEALASAYNDWVLSGFPTPPLSYVSTPSKDILKGFLLAPVFSGWGPGLNMYWLSITITGPGFVPANGVDPVTLGLIPGLVGQLSADLLSMVSTASQDKNETLEGIADKLSSKLFTFTTSLMFQTITTSVPPVKASVPVA